MFIRLFTLCALGLSLCATPGCTARPTTPAAATDSVQQAAPTVVPDTLLRQVIYTPADSARVEELLRMQPTGGSDVLFYARHFIGMPYVAHTLEKDPRERLVVNLRELDCTTLVETVLALTMTKRQGDTSFLAYCHNLMRLRYRGGQMNGYLSRLHYFTWWMHDNVARGTMQHVEDAQHFTAPITVNNFYMSQHADQYAFLRGNAAYTDSIRAMEQAANGPDGCYLPEEATALPQNRLKSVHDGDLVAIVTTKAGLDYSHLGFAVWGKDGRLHLLNASSVRHRVVEEPMTLHRYLKERKTSVGIRLLRLADSK